MHFPNTFRTGLAFLFLLLLSSFAAAGPEAPQQESAEAERPPLPEAALVLAAFGTAEEKANDPLASTEAELRRRYPNMTLRRAYTSANTRRAMRERGQSASSLAGALAALSDEGFKRAVVVSVHVTPGKEYDLVRDTASRFENLSKGIQTVEVTRPLIGSMHDAERVAAALAAGLPPERDKADAVVFVGHGAENGSGSLGYAALEHALQRMDSRFFVDQLEEGPEEIASRLEKAKPGRVWVMPLLFTIGDHAKNDVFGPEKESRVNFLKARGFDVRPLPLPLGEVKGIAGVLADHAGEVLDAPLQ